MINKSTIKQANKYCCEDISLIENYEEAVKSEKRYCCHHRNGLHKSREELKGSGLYYHRPANELVFLEIGEHIRLHNKGENNGMYGRHRPEETRLKISNALKGKLLSNEHRQNISNSLKGAKNPLAKQCAINGISYGCLKDAYRELNPNYSYNTFRKKYKEGKL